MKNIIIYLLITFMCSSVFSQDWEKLHKLITEGITATYNVDFNSALAKFQEAKKISSADLRGPFFEATVYFWRCMFSKNKNDLNTYLDLSGKLTNHCEEIIDKNENDLDARFYLGWTYTMRAFILGYIDQNYLKSASDIKDGIKNLEFVVEKNPAYYDAYLGLGIYNYTVTLIPRKLQWLTNILGFTGDREEGKKQLRLASEKGTYTNNEAKFYLSIFAWREEDFTLAENYAIQLRNTFTESPAVWMFWGMLMSQQDKMNEAVQAYQTSLQLNKINEPIIFKAAYGALGSAYFRLNNFELASEYGKKYISFSSKDDNINNRLYAIAVSLELLGRRNEALEYYKQGRSDFNELNEWEKYWLRKLHQREAKPVSFIDSLLIIADNNRAAGKLDEAIKVYELLQSGFDQIYTDDISAQINHGLAQVYFKKKDFGKSLELFQRNFTLNPAEEKWLIPEAHFQAGRCSLRLGRKEDAKDYFEKAESFDYDYDFKNAMDGKIKNELSKF